MCVQEKFYKPILITRFTSERVHLLSYPVFLKRKFACRMEEGLQYIFEYSANVYFGVLCYAWTFCWLLSTVLAGK